MTIRNYARAAALALGIAVAVIVTACGSDTEELEARLAAIESQTAETHAMLEGLDETLRTANMIAAMAVLNQAGFHHIDVMVQRYTEVDREFLPTLRNARRVAQTAAWPHALQPGADALVEAIKAIEAAFEAEDLNALKAAATAAHDRFHAIEPDVNDLMEGREPQGGHHGDGDSMGEHG